MPDMSKILDQIRTAIETGDKTRYRLSKETGIDQAQLSRLMSGTGAMSFENLERLAGALGLEIIIRPSKSKAGNKGR
jgi:hypothetical protein